MGKCDTPRTVEVLEALFGARVVSVLIRVDLERLAVVGLLQLRRCRAGAAANHRVEIPRHHMAQGYLSASPSCLSGVYREPRHPSVFPGSVHHVGSTLQGCAGVERHSPSSQVTTPTLTTEGRQCEDSIGCEESMGARLASRGLFGPPVR